VKPLLPFPENSEGIAQLFFDAPLAVFLLDTGGECFLVNRRFTAITGLTRDEVEGAAWVKVLPEAERAGVLAELPALLQTGERIRREFKLHGPTGAMWVICELGPLTSAEAGSYAFAGWLADVTERKQAEAERAELTEKLRRSEELHELVQRVGKFAHWTMRPADDRPFWSPEMFALWGRRPEEGPPLVEELFLRADPVDRSRLKLSAEQLLKGTADEVEYRVLAWDGVHRWIHARREAVIGPGGEIDRVVGIAQDVTWRHEAQREQAQRERFLLTLTMALPDPAFVHDGEKVIFANEALAHLLGWDSPEELIGTPSIDLFPSGEHERKRARIRRALAGGNNPGIESALLRRDGSACPAELSSLAAEYDGNPAVLEVARDLSARRAAEEQRLVSDRAAALATLASGVAHEVNNPLAWLQSNMEMITEGLERLERETPSPVLRELAQMAREAREGAQRVKTIVRDLQTFSSKPRHEMRPQDPTDALELALRLVDHELRGRCQVVKRYETAPLVQIDRALLAQAFVNLIANAAQAMAGGDPGLSRLRVSVSTAPDGGAQIVIADNGPGIPAGNLPRVFEPFFTTKPVGSGTGLGLSVALNSVKSFGGEITVESEEGKGAAFTVRLPRSGVLGPQSEPPPIREQLPRVLVVDDDPQIGQSLRRLLGRECEVQIATSAAGALEAVENQEKQQREGAATGSFALLLVDLVMPGADGIELYEMLRASAPQMAARVVFMTGGAASRRERAFLDAGKWTLVEKPFQAARVRAMVRDAIQAGHR
jgi:two-component system cell cycle sensor histidine kinase/response regulator CckA